MNHTNSKASEDNQIWLGMVSTYYFPHMTLMLSMLII
jgi:hypothetical protein